MRKPRKLKQDARYHVIARANRQEFILHSKKIKEMFLQVVKQAKKKYVFSVVTLCIMSNHIHFILKPSNYANLSKIMQWILGTFAMRFNKLFNLKGHVWYDRFKSKILNNYREFQATFVYIALNPVRAKIVKDPFSYKYNGITLIKKGDFSIIEPPDILVTLCPLPIIPTLLTGK